jgi:hypothetical protein
VTRIVDKSSSELRLSRDGRWFHRGEPFENEKIIRFFHRAIRKDDKGDYYLYNRVGDLEENVYFEVEETAYCIWELLFDEKTQAFSGILNTGVEVPLDLHSLVEDDHGVMTCLVLDGDRARFNYRALEQLSSHATLDGDTVRIEVAGEIFLIPFKSADP